MFEIELLNKIGQWQFPGFLFGVGKAAKFPGIQTQFPGHLYVGMRKMASLPRIDPSLIFLRNFFPFCYRLVSSEAAFPAKLTEWAASLSKIALATVLIGEVDLLG